MGATIRCQTVEIAMVSNRGVSKPAAVAICCISSALRRLFFGPSACTLEYYMLRRHEDIGHVGGVRRLGSIPTSAVRHVTFVFFPDRVVKTSMARN